jgi:hypothetical protein
VSNTAGVKGYEIDRVWTKRVTIGAYYGTRKYALFDDPVEG